MDTSLKGRRALVCGSTQGIGRAAAIELALLGAQVTLMARDPVKLKAVAAELPRPNGQPHDFISADFADPNAVAAAVKPHIDATRPFHILINNTGGPKGGPAHAANPEDFAAAFRMHVLTNQVLVQALLPGAAVAATVLGR